MGISPQYCGLLVIIDDIYIHIPNPFGMEDGFLLPKWLREIDWKMMGNPWPWCSADYRHSQ
jgi:hypothetical protein